MASVKPLVSSLLWASRHQVCSKQSLTRSLPELTRPDSVILLMAIHTALTVFASRKPSSQNGLYRYRWGAYACWALFSILMAALAFINPSSPYVSQGTFCYLPTRPIWYRLALSWIPRYLILCTILGIYLAVYLYTRSKFGTLTSDSAPTAWLLRTPHSTVQKTDNRPGHYPALTVPMILYVPRGLHR